MSNEPVELTVLHYFCAISVSSVHIARQRNSSIFACVCLCIEEIYSRIMERGEKTGDNPVLQGCGSKISINVCPTTGGDFFLTVEPYTTIENLKKQIAKKLKVSKERICLLYREKYGFSVVCEFFF